MRDNLGREMKKCTRCGNYFYPNRFYKRVVVRKGKEYHLLTSWCRMCTAEVNNERAKRKNNTDRSYRRNSGETIFDLEERFKREMQQK